MIQFLSFHFAVDDLLHTNVNGLFVAPVPLTMVGSLLWDGEHRFPNTVGPEGLKPAKAWEIHPIKQLTER